MEQKTLEKILKPLTEGEIVEALREKFKGNAGLLSRLKQYRVPLNEQTPEDFIHPLEIDVIYQKHRKGYQTLKQKGLLAIAKNPKRIIRQDFLMYVLTAKRSKSKKEEALFYHGCRTVEELIARFPGLEIPAADSKVRSRKRGALHKSAKQTAHENPVDEQATLEALVNWNPENLEDGIPFVVIEYYFGKKSVVTKRFHNEEGLVWPYDFFSYFVGDNRVYGMCRKNLLTMFRKRSEQEGDLKRFMQSYCTVHGQGTRLIIKQRGEENGGDEDDGAELSLNFNGEYSLRETANYLGGDTDLVQELIDSGKLILVSEGVVYGASIARQIRAFTGDYSLLRQLNVCGEKTSIYPDSAIEDAINLAVQKLGLTKEGKLLQSISLEINVRAYTNVPEPIAAQVLNCATRILNVLIPSQEYNPVVTALECMNRILEQYITGTGGSLESVPENLLSGLLGVVKRHFNKFSKQMSIGAEEVARFQSAMSKAYLVGLQGQQKK